MNAISNPASLALPTPTATGCRSTGQAAQLPIVAPAAPLPQPVPDTWTPPFPGYVPCLIHAF